MDSNQPPFLLSRNVVSNPSNTRSACRRDPGRPSNDARKCTCAIRAVMYVCAG